MALIGDDCYFFLNSGCVRGNQCVFRHQPAAKNTKITCPDWSKRSCFKATCILRHMEMEASDGRSNIPCYYDNAQNGCLNSQCPFLHLKKSTAETVQPATVSTQSAVSNKQEMQVTEILPTEVTQFSIQQKVTPTATLPINSSMPGSRVVTNRIVSHLVPARAMLSMPSHPLTQIQMPQIVACQPNLNPIVIPPQPTIIKVAPPQPAHMSILGAPPANLFPKNAHFTQQVQLFKKILAAKNSTVGTNNGQRKHKAGQYNSDGDDDYYNGGKHKYKERQRNKREKKEKEGTKSSKNHKRTKDVWSKGDEEILYGDYKDIPVSKKQKKGKRDRHADSDSEVNIKSYEEILRNKALQNVMNKRKEKFNEDFDDLVSFKSSKSKKSKITDSDNNADEEEKHNLENSKKKDVDIENEIFSKEDAVELGLNDSPIRAEIDDFSPAIEDLNHDKKRESSSDKGENTRTDAEDAVLVIPDETAEINFSVDDNDDLAKELSQTMENEVKPSKSKNKVLSVVSIIKKDSHESKLRSPEPQQDVRRKSPNTRLKSPEKQLSNKTVIAKRNIVKLTASSKSEKDSGVPSPVMATVSSKNVIKITESPLKTKSVKVKSFAEIMAEKRKRRLGNKEVLVISDGSDSSLPPTVVDPLKVKSAKAKSELQGVKPKNDKVVIDVVESPDSNEKSKLAAKRGRLKRLGSNDDDDNKQPKRKSIQLYKPPNKPENTVVPQAASEVKTVVDTGARKIIRIRKSSLSTELLDKPANDTTQNESQSENGSNTVEVRSFAEIMREKRLRKQREQELKQQEKELSGTKANPPEQSSLIKRKCFIKRAIAVEANDPINDPINTQTSSTTSTVTSAVETSVVNNAAESNMARVSPLHVVPKKHRSESLDEETLLGPTPPTTAVSKEVDNVFKRDSTSPGVVPRLSVSPIKDRNPPPVSLQKLGSASPVSEVPSVSPTVSPQVTNNGSTVEQSLYPNNAVSSNTPVMEKMEKIQEALDEKERQRQEELLSDEEFEKEINNLCPGDDDDDNLDDIDEDDLLMELEQMIDS